MRTMHANWRYKTTVKLGIQGVLSKGTRKLDTFASTNTAMDYITSTLILASIIAYFWYRGTKRPENCPPGPFQFPLVGNIPQYLWAYYVRGMTRQELYQEYGKRYGPIFSLKFGQYKVIVLDDPKLIKKAFNMHEITGRSRIHLSAVKTGGTIRGILFHDGEEWEEQRRFTLRNLREFGFGKQAIVEEYINDEVDDMMEGLRKVAGQKVTTELKFGVAMLNVVWRMVSGKRLPHEKPELQDGVRSLNTILCSAPTGLLLFLPILKHIFPSLSGWKNFTRNTGRSTGFVQRFVDQRLQERSSDEIVDDPQDFTDVYINEMKKATDPSSSFYGKRGELSMFATVLDLFLAAVETTATTMRYFCLYMSLRPDIQRKVQEEVQSVLGNRKATLDDRPKLPYLEAAIMETLRLSSVVPLGIYHRAIVDCKFGEYQIPQGTLVISNLYSIHHSEKHWKDAYEFKPERFISEEDGSMVCKNEAFLPFSIGKRVCIGEKLAKDELFLFSASIMQEFWIKPGEENLKARMLYTNVICPPRMHELIFQKKKGGVRAA